MNIWAAIDNDSFWGTGNKKRTNDKPLRAAIGILAVLLAPVCYGLAAIQGTTLDSSVSHYYHSVSRDYFEGVLFLVGVFFLVYRGHQRIDTIYTWVLGLLALSVATFPCALDGVSKSPLGVFQLNSQTSDLIHLISAVTFFILLTVYVLFFFTRSKADPSVQKRRKNVVFVVCGLAMAALLLLVVFLAVRYGVRFNDELRVMFWIEFGLLFFFGIAWFFKSNVVPGFVDPP